MYFDVDLAKGKFVVTCGITHVAIKMNGLHEQRIIKSDLKKVVLSSALPL